MHQEPAVNRNPNFIRRIAATAAALTICLPWQAARAQESAAPAQAFHAHCAKAAATGEGMALRGQDGWAFLRQEIAHLGKGPLTKESVAPAVTAISSWQKALAQKGVELVVLPIPAKAEIYPDKFMKGADPQALKGRLALLFTELQSNGVAAVDLAAALHERRATEAPEDPSYCLRDAHWSPKTARLAAEKIADLARKPAAPAGAPKIQLGAERPLKISGDLLDDPAVKPQGAETVLIVPCGTGEGQDLTPVPAAKDAPVILLGDSHTLVFSEGASQGFHCQGAGLLDHVQERFGFPVMQYSVPAGGANNARMKLARDAFARPEFWQGKKLVIWCFAVRELTDKWREIPVSK
jgi:alginate O-acetyltransferase complex protein AlgJ